MELEEEHDRSISDLLDAHWKERHHHWRKSQKSWVAISHGLALRLKARRMLAKALETHVENEDVFLAEHTTFHCLYWRSRVLYCRKIRQLAFNLQRNAKEILSYTPTLWPFLDADQLSQGTPVALQREEIRRKLSTFVKPKEVGEGEVDEQRHTKETTLVGKCRHCRSYNTDFYELQTRSADEGMTVFKFCRDCGKKWK